MGWGTLKIPRDMGLPLNDDYDGMNSTPTLKTRRFMAVDFRCWKASNVERDALGQLDLAAEIDGAGLPTHVGLPGVGPAFAAATGLLFAAEGATDLRAAGARIHVRD